jgi:hypothetical protein
VANDLTAAIFDGSQLRSGGPAPFGPPGDVVAGHALGGRALGGLVPRRLDAGRPADPLDAR